MKKYFFIICIVSLISSCAMFDGISDISISLNSPDEIVVVNNARVSTLRNIKGDIVRSGTSVYHFDFDIDIPASRQDAIKVDDFIIQNTDKVFVIDAKFSWDM